MTAKLKSDFLNIMVERGFFNQCTNLEGLDDLFTKETVTAYTGFDPTADSLHIGHLIPQLMMRWLQKCGHKPIALAGGVTGMIGDPSGKDESRKFVTEDFIKGNIGSICKALYQIYSFEDTEKAHKAILVNNADWLRKLNYIDFLRDYGIHFSINRMISMDSVKTRLERESHLSFLEFNYMILQGFDFLHLYREYGCRLQLSGADQWGNVLQGVELGRRLERNELFGLSAPLLLTSSGKKMGKTEAGAVWLNEDKLSNYDFYQYWRNAEDKDVGKLLKIFTDMPMSEIAKLEALKGNEINEAKKILAFEVTKLVRGEKSANDAAEVARKTFEEGVAGEGLPTVKVSLEQLQAGIAVMDVFKQAGFATSNGEVRRLIAGGGAKINDVKVEADDRMLTDKDLLDNGTIKISSGKKNHAIVTIA